MAVNFTAPLEELVQVEELKTGLRRGLGPLMVTGCVESQKAHLICALTEGRPLTLVITYNEVQARELLEDISCFREDVFLYPAKDVLFFQADIQGNLLAKERMAVIRQILEEKKGTIITTIDGCLDRIASPEEVYRRQVKMKVGDFLDLAAISRRLTELGYEREYQVESSGQYSVRGGILDIFPLTEQNPVRIELWGDEVDSIRWFDAESQRSLENLEEIHLYGADEMPEVVDGKYVSAVSILSYFDEEAAILLDEPARLTEKALAVSREFKDSMQMRLEKGFRSDEPTPELMEVDEVWEMLNRPRSILVSGLEQKSGVFRPRKSYTVQGRTTASYAGNFEGMIRDLQIWKRDGWRVILLSDSRTRAEHLAESLREYELNAAFSGREEARIPLPGQILTAAGSIRKSFEYPEIRFAVISEGDLLGGNRRKKKKPRYSVGKGLRSFEELSVGDYVVHENHGIGVYQGLEKVEVSGISKDYLKIVYGDGGILYVPVTKTDLIQKYASADTGQAPKLNKLTGNEWHKTKTRVRHAVKDIAADLVRLYARRRDASGFVYSPDTVWQKEFEERFPFEETEDQMKAIDACKADMESTKIMDRLICGDVGYGKTEIALRAAFKAVQDGKQVAYLAPTTILAQQHYNTFLQRMKDYPVGIELLCRFRSPAEQKKSLGLLKKGASDIAIGTHRLLSKDVQFKDLGLLIIDEEQRFGVADKEKIKQMKDTVDVLSLTATPIPRTLHMSLVGIRDMSVLEEPPMDRQPIQTYVMEYNEELVREAIQRELSRSGQVYYVYNKVKSIQEMTARIQSLVPEAVVSFAHGQMKERQLEQIMLDFVQGDIDVLVSTTIIETGLDISNVNTIIIHDADRFGLAQLYQLRGRVGRSTRSACAFLMYRRDKMLKETAEKRLAAIREYTELGSGIRIAMRALELRGAGNILGAEQSGHMEAVGYDLYCKLLGEAVQEVKGEKAEQEEFETTIELKLDIYIPETYIRQESVRLEVYKRIAMVASQEEYEEMQDELIDRFGDIPRPVQYLLQVSLLRSLAHAAYITEISGTFRELLFTIFPQAPVDPTRIQPLFRKYPGELAVVPGDVPVFKYTDKRRRIGDTSRMLEMIRILIEDIRGLLRREEGAHAE